MASCGVSPASSSGLPTLDMPHFSDIASPFRDLLFSWVVRGPFSLAVAHLREHLGETMSLPHSSSRIEESAMTLCVVLTSTGCPPGSESPTSPYILVCLAIAKL